MKNTKCVVCGCSGNEESLREQLRATESERDQAGRRYVAIAGELHDAQGKIAELEAELGKEKNKVCETRSAMNQHIEALGNEIDRTKAELAYQVKRRCDETVILQQDVASLEAELTSASEAFAERDIERVNRIRELEAEVAYEKESNLDNVGIYSEQVKNLEAELAEVNEAGEVLHARCRELEAELAKSKDDLLTCQFHDRHHVTVLKECSNAIKELEAINQALTASCDDTWHCACIVPLQKRIAELEREKQMYKNASERNWARVKELEAELARSNKLLTHSGIVKAQEEYNRLALDNARLRECLERLEWAEIAYGFGGATAKRCPACRAIGELLYEGHGHYRQPEGHAPDCWLAAEIEREGLERE